MRARCQADRRHAGVVVVPRSAGRASDSPTMATARRCRARRRRDHRRVVRLRRERAAGRDLRPGAAGRRYEVEFEIASGPASSCSPRWPGLVELVPEYAGSALQFGQHGHPPLRRTSRPPTALDGALDEPAGGARPRPAQDANAVVVTRWPIRYALDEISDLRSVASRHDASAARRSAPTAPAAWGGSATPTGWSSPTSCPLDVGGPARRTRPWPAGTSTWRCCSRPTPGTAHRRPGRAGRRPRPAAGRERHAGVRRRWSSAGATASSTWSTPCPRLTTEGLRRSTPGSRPASRRPRWPPTGCRAEGLATGGRP